MFEPRLKFFKFGLGLSFNFHNLITKWIKFGKRTLVLICNNYGKFPVVEVYQGIVIY